MHSLRPTIGVGRAHVYCCVSYIQCMNNESASHRIGNDVPSSHLLTCASRAKQLVHGGYSNLTSIRLDLAPASAALKQRERRTKLSWEWE